MILESLATLFFMGEVEITPTTTLEVYYLFRLM